VNKYCAGGVEAVANIRFSRSVGKELSGTRYDIYFTLRLWLCAYDRLEGDAHKKYRLYLWCSIAKDARQPGSGEVLAACLDGRTGYVEMGFRA
jgi:hypothetical protein